MHTVEDEGKKREERSALVLGRVELEKETG